MLPMLLLHLFNDISSTLPICNPLNNTPKIKV